MNTGLLNLLVRTGLVEQKTVDDASEGQVLLRSACPIHKEADNPTGFVMQSSTWFCNTAGCHEKYGVKLEGLVVALADRYAEPPIRVRDKYGNPEFKAARQWLAKEGGRLQAVFADRPTTRCSGKPRNSAAPAMWCSRQRALDSLQVPSKYFLARGFAPDTLRAYSIGDPVPGGAFDRLAGWAVVPLFNLDYPRLDDCVGYAARNHQEDQEPRWKLSPGFPSDQRLFNHMAGERAADRARRLLLVEGVGDALRCVEAGHLNVMAVLGSSLLEEQVFRLMQVRFKDVVVVADKDEPGRKFAAQVQKRMVSLAESVRVIIPPDPFKDIGAMPTPAAREFLNEALLSVV